jgi:hypothetical protein
MSTLEYHKNLNQKLWDDWVLRADARSHILAVAQKWADYCNLTESDILDVQITGGNVNYNFTPKSDVDIHVLVDHAKLGFDTLEIFQDYVRAKKVVFDDSYPITIKGYPIEVYLQDISEKPHKDQGVYSVSKNIWIAKPIYVKDMIPFRDVELAASKQKSLVIDCIKNQRAAVVARAIKDNITKVRKTSIGRDGEFAFENLIFKELRNDGTLEALDSYIKRRETEELTLHERQALEELYRNLRA